MKKLIITLAIALMMASCIQATHNTYKGTTYKSNAYFDRGEDAHLTAEEATESN